MYLHYIHVHVYTLIVHVYDIHHVVYTLIVHVYDIHYVMCMYCKCVST